MRIAGSQYLVIFHFEPKIHLQKKIGADTLVSSFRMYYCTKKR